LRCSIVGGNTRRNDCRSEPLEIAPVGFLSSELHHARGTTARVTRTVSTIYKEIPNCVPYSRGLQHHLETNELAGPHIL
jgi:hypothetical protein